MDIGEMKIAGKHDATIIRVALNTPNTWKIFDKEVKLPPLSRCGYHFPTVRATLTTGGQILTDRATSHEN